MKITCLGSGFVGGPTSAVAAFKSDAIVTVVDTDEGRIAAWNSECLPIYEPGLYDIIQAAGDRLSFSTDIDTAIASADIIFICVNTPMSISNGRAPADLTFLEAATRNIARVARADKIVVEKSTVPCRTAQAVREILLAEGHRDIRFEVLSNPEFLAEGTAVENLLNPDRVIIGSTSTASGLRAASSLVEVYAQWVPRERIVTMSLWSSELSKLAANAMLAQRISSVNALSAICEPIGADVDEVSLACGLDSRIGPGMLKAGPGFGGSCFKKDIMNIIYLSESLDLEDVADYWRAILKMNDYQKRRIARRIKACLSDNLTERNIAVLGFSFKNNTSDCRESPAITLVNSFVEENARVAIYDPKVSEEHIWRDLAEDSKDLDKLRNHVRICQSAYATCAGADTIVVVTDWDEFGNKAEDTRRQILPPIALKEKDANLSLEPSYPQAASRCSSFPVDTAIARLDWERVFVGMRKPMMVFDTRNFLDLVELEKLGFKVEGVGKSSALG